MPVPVPVPVPVLIVALVGCGHPAPAPAPPPPRVAQLNAPGEMVDVEAALVPGHVTIIDFWAEWCGACELVDAAIMTSIGDTPGIVVRKVHVGDGDTPVADTYDAQSLPYVRVYDATGTLRYALRYNDAFTAGDKALTLRAAPAPGRAAD